MFFENAADDASLDYLALALPALLIAAITAWASRRTLFATLDDID